MQTTKLDLTTFIRDVADFPKKGILFKDITPLLKSHEAFTETIERLVEPYRGERVTQVAAIESRGFIFGAPVAKALGCGFVPIRKPGKLPWTTYRNEYALEYGTDALEIHRDAFEASDRVLIVDDVLATGGTAAAAGSLVGQVGATVVGYSMLIELTFLSGRQKLGGVPFHAAIQY